MTTESMIQVVEPEHRIMRLAEVEKTVGFKRTHIYNLIKLDRFPRPLRIGIRAIGWDSAEIAHWVSERLKDRV
ncbi:AlpA family phage regulatory protein [Pseudomonas huaxiensis]|uniref:AlpA family phage regulatory protein n=1 Tax=Pseudomonas huaxiensis TaxID=2213017 RepID=UPI000DA6A27A|nr:AlpA family phage regulatory protein [Pseudomonas huaxiensis]